MKTPYYEKLQNPKWQKKRLEIMERDGFCCRDCGEKEKQLQVHHTLYVASREPWEHPSFTLVTLCDKCHKERHRSLDDEDVLISSVEALLYAVEWHTGGDLVKLRDLRATIYKLKENE